MPLLAPVRVAIWLVVGMTFGFAAVCGIAALAARYNTPPIPPAAPPGYSQNVVGTAIYPRSTLREVKLDGVRRHAQSPH